MNHACMREHWFSKILVCLLTVLIVSFSLSTFLVPHAEAAENSWTIKASMPTARSGLGIAVVSDEIYAIGGHNGSGVVPANEKYTPIGYIPEFPNDEKPTTPTNEPFPTTWIVAAVIIIAAVGATFLVYFGKIRKTTGEIKEQDLRE